MGTTPTTGAGSPHGDGPGVSPNLSERLALSHRIVGAPSPLIGPHDARPAGVALRSDADKGETFEIALVDRAADVLMVLGPFEEEDVVAVWRSLARASGLPLMIQGPDGALQSPFPQVGPVQLGEIRIRRLYGFLKGRRPRFLVRRTTGNLGVTMRIEGKEIIARR